MNLFKSLIFVYAVSVCFYSFKIILNENKVIKLNRKILSLKEGNIDVIKDRIKPEDLIRDYTVGFGSYVDYDLYNKQAILSLIVANKAKAQSIKDEYLCLALEGLYNALKLEPYNSDLLRAYAFNRRLILDKKCSFLEERANYNEVISLALKKAPQNIRVIRDAGRIQLLDGNLIQAASYYKKYQTLSRERNPLVDRGVEYLISQNIELSKLLPPVYEHLEYWSRRLKISNPNYLKQNINDIIPLQKETILNQRKYYEQPVVVIGRLISLSENVVSDKIRKLIDRELIFYMEDTNYDLKNYLSLRSNLNLKKNICGIRVGDSRPDFSNIIDWGSQRTLYLDADYNSVGCYVSSNSKIIEIVGIRKDAKLKPEDLEVYISTDNYNWKIVPSVKFKKIDYPNRTLLYLDYPKTTARYIKFRFNQVRSQDTFYNKINKLVNFYG